ncbi:MAG: hypothetical protein ACI9XO_003873 [Paraglaciecola sp.]|jgi:hypothetical protein
MMFWSLYNSWQALKYTKKETTLVENNSQGMTKE